VKKFRFRLQSILEAREKALEDRQLELAKLLNELRLQEQRLEELYSYQHQTKKSLENLIEQGSKIDFTTIKNHYDYIDKLADDIRNQHKVIVDTEMQVEEKKQEVLEALKAKTMMEKLKEKDYKKFLDEFEAYEAKEIDEIAINRHGRSL